jgi:4-amino-4-deoxy-L-arabinose transferase-like glycosyltransferase
MYNLFGVAGIVGLGEAGMAKSLHTRKKLVAFLCVLALSSLTMLWLFWRFPVPTAILTFAALAGFVICTRLARAMDTTDMDRGSQLR